MLPGDEKTCTITNDDVAPTLTLVKTVINDNGGELTQTDFPSFVNGVSQAWDVTTVFQANLPLIASETSQIGYTPSSWGGDCAADGTITLLPGDAKICSITNDDAGATLTLVKTVTNDDGGLLTQTDFPSFVDGVPQAWGVATAVTTNVEHTASETPQTGYTPSAWGGDCAEDGTITLLPGDEKTCSITNDDVAPLLTLIKDPTNDGSGTALPDDFEPTVGGVVVVSGESNPYEANLAYAIDETLLDGYSFVSIDGDDKCPAELGGTVTLDLGDDITCTITNDDDPSMINLAKTSQSAVNVGGNTWEVVYTITASNTGESSGVYDIIDTMMPGDGITPEIDASYPELVYVGGETQTGVLATPPLANGGTWVTLERLAGMASETWTVTARFTVDEQFLANNPRAADCVLEDGEQGTGYFNYVEGSETDDDLSDNETCVPHLLPSTPVPTLSTWAMLLMILLMTGVAGWYFRPVQMRRTS